MPSVTDIQQQSSKISSNNNGKSTPPLQQQQQTSSTLSGITTDVTNADPITQAILMLEKKQRNLGKRKEKLESYEQEAKSGKELHKDQKEALAKYGEVIGQIECAKDIYEQLKKIQIESAKNQKRLTKQAAEEKRTLVSQRLREYTQLRYLLDHRPSSLKSEDSSLLDELARVIIPSDISLNTITRCIDTVLSIYQGNSTSTVKNLPGRTSQEVRDTLEQLIKLFETNNCSNDTTTTTCQQIPFIETVKQTPLIPQPPPTTPASVLPQREQDKQQQQQQQQSNNNTDVLGSSLSHTHLVLTNPNEYPLQFDTRNQNIPFQDIIQDSPFFPVDPTITNNNQESTINQDNNNIQSNDQKHYLQTFTVLNSALTSQAPPQGYTQTLSAPTQQHQGMDNYDQKHSSNIVNPNNISSEEQSEEQWQHRRSNSGNIHRGGQNNGTGNRNYNRGGGQNNYNQQHWRGPRGGHYDGSYGGGQRQYHENNSRGGGGQRGGSNSAYRGNRGGGYRGNKRGGATGYNGNEYQKSSQYPQNNGQQQQQVRSAPPTQQQ
jgi:caprin-1